MRPLICLANTLIALTCTLQGCGKLSEPSNDAATRKPLRVGQPAPEIVGEDLDGAPMKLSDYRGKVVLLSFYGEWCGYCVKQFPHEMEIVETHKGQPFVLLGVNGHPDSREEARQAAVRRGLTWRSFSAGDPQQGEIPKAYRIRGWPTFFLIDPQGVIRHISHTADREMEVAINVLLDEAAHKQ